MSAISANEADAKAVAGASRLGEEEAALNRDILEEYYAARSPRYVDAVENDRFYHNVQYTEAEKAQIIADGQAPLAINTSYAIIKQMISLLTSNRPTWDVLPVGDTDKQFAYLNRNLLYAMWYFSKGNRELEWIIKDMLITGAGWGVVAPDTRTGFGAIFEHVSYHHVYPDPAVRRPDFTDAENLAVCKTLSNYQIARLLHMKVDELDKYLEEGSEMIPALHTDDVNTRYPRYMTPLKNTGPGGKGNRRYCDIVQRSTIERVDAYYVTPVSGNATITRRIYFSLPDSIKELEGKGFVRIERKTIEALAKYISVGSYCERHYLPISTYNLVPFVDEFTGGPSCMGVMDFLYGLQRALNKFILLTILNATLSNNMRLIAPKNAINKVEYENNFANPGSLIEYEWSEGMPEPKPQQPVPLSGQFLAFPQMIISMMEYLTGIFGVVQGNPDGAPRTASGLVSLQSYGGQKSKLLGRHIEDSLSQLGDVAIALFQNYSGFNETVTYFDEQLGANSEPIKYNQLTVDKDLKVRIDNDISSGMFKSRVVIRQDYGSERQAKAAVLTQLAAQTRSPALIRPILKLADVPEADAIADQLDALSQANQSIEQLQSNMKRMQQINTQLENEVLRKSRAVKTEAFVAELSKLKANIEKELGIGAVQTISDFQNNLQQMAAPDAGTPVDETTQQGTGNIADVAKQYMSQPNTPRAK